MKKMNEEDEQENAVYRMSWPVFLSFPQQVNQDGVLLQKTSESTMLQCRDIRVISK